MQNNGFAGITPTPSPSANPDGSFTVKLTPAEFQTFQDNQKNQPAAAAPAPAGAPADDSSISVTQDPSTLMRFFL